jgi:hypothetical protein
MQKTASPLDCEAGPEKKQTFSSDDGSANGDQAAQAKPEQYDD